VSKFIAIDLDTQGIFAAAGFVRAGHAKLEQANAWDGTDGDPPPALTADTARTIGEQLRDRLKAAGIAQAPVLVSIPRDRVILKELKYPAVPLTEEPNIVKFQAMKELTDSPDDIVLDYVPLSSSTEGERRSMAVVVRKDLLLAIQAMCTAANLKLAAVTPRPYGVAAGLIRVFATGTAPGPENKSEPIATLTLGPGGGEFTVVRGGTSSDIADVIFTRTIAAPALASETMVLAEVRRNLTMYAGANPGHPIQVLYVAEAGSRWSNRLRGSLGISVHAYDPLAGLPPDAVPESSRGRFAGAVGLLAARAKDELPINFTVPRQPRQQGDPKRVQLLLAALLAIALVFGGLAYGMVLVSDSEKELVALRAKKTQLEDDVKAMEPDSKRLAAVKQWQGRGVVWLDMLFDLTDQFQHTPGFQAISFTAKNLPPDAKTAKQDAQSSVEIKVFSRGPEPVNSLIAAMEQDNPEKKKFYQNVSKVIAGTAQGDAAAKEYTVMARVTSRNPDQFSRNPRFTPPSRKNYPPTPASAKEKDPKAETEETKDESGEK
jgi:hypothetical protein